jgi:hypothetical protein
MQILVPIACPRQRGHCVTSHALHLFPPSLPAHAVYLRRVVPHNRGGLEGRHFMMKVKGNHHKELLRPRAQLHGAVQSACQRQLKNRGRCVNEQMGGMGRPHQVLWIHFANQGRIDNRFHRLFHGSRLHLLRNCRRSCLGPFACDSGSPFGRLHGSKKHKKKKK